MNSVRIFHTADVHFGAPTRGLKIPAKLQERTAALRLDAFRGMMERAGRDRIDAVIVAGDLFDRPRGADLYAAAVRDASAAASPVDVILIPGNHDYWTPDGVWTRGPWPTNVTIVHGPQVEQIRLANDQATIFAHGWNSRNLLVSPFCNYQPPPRAPGEIRIAVAHGSEVSSQPHHWRRYGAFHATHFDALQPNYVALGHLHWANQTTSPARTTVTYPGSFASTGFDDTGRKTYIDATISQTEVCAIHVPTGALDFYRLTVQASEVAHLQQAINRSLCDQTADSKSAVLWIEIIGSAPPSTAKSLPELHANLKPLFAHLTIHEQIASITDRAADENQRTPTDIFLAAINELIDDEPNKTRRTLYERVREHGLTALSSREAPRRGNLYQ